MPVVGLIEPCDTYPTTYVPGGYNNLWIGPANSGPGSTTPVIDTVDKVEGVGSLSLSQSGMAAGFPILLTIGNGMGWGATMPSGGISNANPILFFALKASSGVSIRVELMKGTDNSWVDYGYATPPADTWTQFEIDLRQSLGGIIDLDAVGFWQIRFTWTPASGTVLPAQVGKIDNITYGTSGETQLSVSVAPTSANVTVGTPVTFTATPINGAIPYTVEWVDNNSQAVIGTGLTYEFLASTEGVYEIFARATDANNVVATSGVVTITVTSVPVPTYTLTIDSTPISGVPFTITQV